MIQTHLPNFFLASVMLLIVSSCQTPQKEAASSRKDAKERVASARNEPIPRPMLRNRHSGTEISDERSGRSRHALIGRGAVATVRTSRIIDMRYMLDLYEHNSKAKEVSEILDKRDSSIRDCYSDRIRSTPGLRGTLTFAFKYSRRTPGLFAVQRTGGSINDPFLESCISAELQRIPVATYVSGRGELRYSFKVVSQRQSVEPVAGVAR